MSICTTTVCKLKSTVKNSCHLFIWISFWQTLLPNNSLNIINLCGVCLREISLNLVFRYASAVTSASFSRGLFIDIVGRLFSRFDFEIVFELSYVTVHDSIEANYLGRNANFDSFCIGEKDIRHIAYVKAYAVLIRILINFGDQRLILFWVIIEKDLSSERESTHDKFLIFGPLLELSASTINFEHFEFPPPLLRIIVYTALNALRSFT